MPRSTATNHRSKASRWHDVGNRSHKSVTWVQAPISLVHRCHRCCFFYGVGVVPPKENDGKILAANFLKLKFSDSEHQCKYEKHALHGTQIFWHVRYLSNWHTCSSQRGCSNGLHTKAGGIKRSTLKRNVHQQIPAKSHQIPDLLSPNNGSIWVHPVSTVVIKKGRLCVAIPQCASPNPKPHVFPSSVWSLIYDDFRLCISRSWFWISYASWEYIRGKGGN